MKKKKNENVNINGNRVCAEVGEVKTQLSEEILKSGYMSVEEDRTIVLADIDKLKEIYGKDQHDGRCCNEDKEAESVDTESKPDEFWEYVRLSERQTGLPYEIYVDNGKAYKIHRHPLWLYVDCNCRIIPVTVEETPKILQPVGEDGFPTDDLFDFIRTNCQLLKNYADEKTDYEVFYHLLKRVGWCTQPSFNQRNCGRTGIRNIVILSSEPQFRPANPKYKNKTSPSLSQTLKLGNYVTAPVTGRIGSEQHLCAVINMSLKSIIYLCEQYNRKSFVYTEFLGDCRTWSEFIEIRDVDKPYWRQSNPYIIKETCERQDAAADTNELFTVKGTQFEYSLPVSTLEHINQVICDNMDKFNRNLISRSAPPHTYDSILHILCGVGYSSFYYKRAIYKGLLDYGI